MLPISTPRSLRGFYVLSALAAAPGMALAAPGAFDCVMEASLIVKVGSPVASIVDDVQVDRGAVVKRGDVIAHIASKVEESAVAYNKLRSESTAEIEAKAAILVQKSGVLRRKLGLAKEHVGASQDVENATAEFNVASQELELAKLNHHMAEIEYERSKAEMELRTVRSPIDGIVTQRSIGPGEYFHQESSIATIARVDPLYVETFLPVSLYQQVKIGDVALVHPAEPIGGEREAKVTVVDQVFDAASGTFGVRLALPNADDGLPAGLRCKVTFGETSAAQASTTPKP